MADSEDIRFEGACGLNTRTSKYVFSKWLPQKPFAAISRRAPSVVMAEAAPEDGSPVMGCKSGLIETLWHTYDISWADTSRISLCRIEGNPPFVHDRTCSTVNSFPQAHVDGMFADCHPYLNATASLSKCTFVECEAKFLYGRA